MSATSRSVLQEEDEILSLRRRLGERIRTVREQKGYSQDVLAALGGLNRSYIGSLERGEHNCGLANLVRVARALEVPVRSLFDVEAPPPLPPAATERPGPGRAVQVDREQFLLLLAQCGQDRPDLVMIYLERCGMVFSSSPAARPRVVP